MSRLVIPDAIVMVQDGKVVAQASAEFDLSGIPEEYRQFLSMVRLRNRIGLPPWEAFDRSVIVMANYERRTQTYDGLPWWRRLFASRPRVSDPINALGAD